MTMTETFAAWALATANTTSERSPGNHRHANGQLPSHGRRSWFAQHAHHLTARAAQHHQATTAPFTAPALTRQQTPTAVVLRALQHVRRVNLRSASVGRYRDSSHRFATTAAV